VTICYFLVTFWFIKKLSTTLMGNDNFQKHCEFGDKDRKLKLEYSSLEIQIKRKKVTDSLQ
jgi:hypothetical protein